MCIQIVKRVQHRITEYINLENSKHDKGDVQKVNICMLPVLLKLPLLLLPLFHSQY